MLRNAAVVAPYWLTQSFDDNERQDDKKCIPTEAGDACVEYVAEVA